MISYEINFKLVAQEFESAGEFHYMLLSGVEQQLAALTAPEMRLSTQEAQDLHDAILARFSMMEAVAGRYLTEIEAEPPVAEVFPLN